MLVYSAVISLLVKVKLCAVLVCVMVCPAYLAKLGNIVIWVMGGKFWKLGGFSEIGKKF